MLVRGEQPLDPLAPFAQVAPDVPVAMQRARQLKPSLAISVGLEAVEGGTKVVVLRIQPGDPGLRVDRDMSMRLLGEREVVRSVAVRARPGSRASSRPYGCRTWTRSPRPIAAPTLAEAAERWQASRVDVAENTRIQHRSALRALLPLLGSRRVDAITAADVAELVAALAKRRKRETIRKMIALWR